mmetsp:Transcript_28215/g.43055  ORF Transcript_28215/g.43055 Transcript_28215/m.43055 type:complete len:80 (+) Transcript_28215:334-573(+)
MMIHALTSATRGFHLSSYVPPTNYKYGTGIRRVFIHLIPPRLGDDSLTRSLTLTIIHSRLQERLQISAVKGGSEVYNDS